MTPEFWIWTELLAFDNAAEDRGIAAYFAKIGRKPDGIALLVSSLDLVLLHRGMEEEYVLYPDNCSRVGHEGNEERRRQDWTNHQLRDLVGRLRGMGVAVYASFFPTYLGNRFHEEWANRHPEVMIVYDDLGVTPGITLLARLEDGRYLEDIFTERLETALLDYGFSGFHGADGCGPAGVVAHNDVSDWIMAQFVEHLGEDAPEELKTPTGHAVAALLERSQWLWRHLRREWTDFNCRRWESCWGKISRMLKRIGCGSMINSPNTKGAFEGIYQHAVDYRRMAAQGVDYLAVETVAANLELIFAGPDRHFDFAATLMDLGAMVPEMKIIHLFGVKDVVESFDLMRHAPGRLEREAYTLSNLYRRRGDGSLKRVADGFLICLGDGLSADEWRYLGRQWDAGYGFDPVRAGDFTWIWSDSAIDNLRDDYPGHGTWPAFKVVGHLTGGYDLSVQTVARIGDLDGVNGPILAPNADLFAPEELRRLLAYRRGPAMLIGHFAAAEIPADAWAVTLPVGEDYSLTAMLLNGPETGAVTLEAQEKTFADTPPPSYFWHPTEYMTVPEEFWRRTAAMLRRVRGGRVAAEDGEGLLRLLSQEDAAGRLRVGLVSTKPTYLEPEWRFDRLPQKVSKVSGFPYTPVGIDASGRLGTGYNCTPLHIPPYGIIVIDAEFTPQTKEENA